MAVKLFIIQVLLIKIVASYVKLDWEPRNPVFDQSFYENALDPELCQTQLSHIRRSSNVMLRLRFLEAGMRFPRGFLDGNFLDMGNYHQCLNIQEKLEDSVLEGKYCMIRGPVNDNLESLAKVLDWTEFKPELLKDDEMVKRYEGFEEMRSRVSLAGANNSRSIGDIPSAGITFSFAICVPKPCTTQEGMRGLLFNLTRMGFVYEDEFCRLKDDKPWVPVDYIAIIVFSLIGLLTLLSTSYDVWYTFIAKKDPKAANTLCRSFSVYNNALRLTTFTKEPNNLECVDGIRTIATMWVIVGHTFQTLPPRINAFDAWAWMFDLDSLWITAAPYTVDTFFMLSGMLVAYTCAGRMTGMRLLKNLHLFYLNRLLRMLPLLSVAVLLQASILNRAADGPMWGTVASLTENCRKYWWSTLIYLQNYLNPGEDCISHGWYLAIDMQLFVLSPIVIFWIGGRRSTAWAALTAGLLASLTAASTYCFIMQFPGWTIARSRENGANWLDYMYYYYFNTLTRAPPFFVGMVFGYLLHVCKGKTVNIPIAVSILLWACTIGITSSAMYVTHLMKDFVNWELFVVDDLVNSFARPLWAAAVGWVIFACHHEYGGPVNWLLSLSVWKLPSRISYGIYIFSYPIQYVISGTSLAPIHFTVASTLYEFLSQMVIAVGVSFVLTLLIDSPFSTLFKLMLGDGPKKPVKDSVDKE